MTYYYIRRRFVGLFVSRRIRTVYKVVIFLVFLISLSAFYLSVVSPEIPQNVFFLKLRGNKSRFIDLKWNCSCEFGSGSTPSNKISTSPGSSKDCLNDQSRQADTDFSTVGWTNFSLIMPRVEPNISCEERKLFMVVVVNSATDDRHRILRMSIRKTWGNLTQGKGNQKWRIYFALGMSSSYAMNLKNVQEALQYNDIIIGNFSDTYKNIVIKTFMSHFWVYSQFDCMYVMKTDDDVYVRVSRLSKWLEKQGFPNPFYGGFLSENLLVVRDPKSPWFVSKEDFNETRWPPFSHGAFQVVSTAILPRCFNYTQSVKRPLTTDNAYFGVMARDLGVNATQIPGFSLNPPKSDFEVMIATAFGHALDSSAMFKYHARYHNLDI
ncbi:beta-1,3-galactosyltransferase 5-like [Actinia tenebrosa]|uniref:Hexosyltransferase n=1 Tax=Actinia tenebrosa TaxID=6105 RepID=A0A6P8IB47_ACTTE|nr:beta-1,3-galactosyltransferase 5-like [Actinia tenebrosa]